jgi:hypothetical protein
LAVKVDPTTLATHKAEDMLAMVVVLVAKEVAHPTILYQLAELLRIALVEDQAVVQQDIQAMVATLALMATHLIQQTQEILLYQQQAQAAALEVRGIGLLLILWVLIHKIIVLVPAVVAQVWEYTVKDLQGVTGGHQH